MKDLELAWMWLHDHEGQPLRRRPDRIHPSTNAVIIEDGQMLLQRRVDTGFWAFPGGRMEIGESAEECVVREVREETGLDCSVTRLVGVYSDPRNYVVLRYPDGTTVHHVVMLFEVQKTGGDLAVSSESSELQFFDVKHLPGQIAPSVQVCIRDVLSGSEEGFSR